jgi:hypothetical protein
MRIDLMDLLDLQHFFRSLVLSMVEDLATHTADQVEEEYVEDALVLVKQRNMTAPADIVDTTVHMVEDKQRWSNLAIRMALGAAGLTRSQVRQKFAADAMAVVNKDKLTDARAIVTVTIKEVREKQGWDKVAAKSTGGA